MPTTKDSLINNISESEPALVSVDLNFSIKTKMYKLRAEEGRYQRKTAIIRLVKVLNKIENKIPEQ